MRTKLSVFCDKLMEAAWLAAAIVLPVLFNVRSAKIFEVDKVTVLRSLALVVALAWVVNRVERWNRTPDDDSEMSIRQRLTAFITRPLVLPVLILGAVQVLATAASVWPHGSLWGSYDRRGGLYTTLSYVTLFLVMVRTLRVRRQVHRLVTLIVISSVAVSLYAIVQRFGLDPVTWQGNVVWRAASTLGNPIWTAAYLIMIVPLALGRAIESFSQSAESPVERVPSFLLGAFYAVVVLLHLTAIMLTQSRGPLMGMLGGMFFFLLLWALSEGRRGMTVVSVTLALLIGVLLLILNLPHTPLTAVKAWPYVGRLATILGDPSFRSRVVMWEGGLEMATETPLRALIGYGPESDRVAFYPYISGELANLLGMTANTGRFTGRLHNEIMEALVTTGVAGVAATLLLFGSLFYWSLRSLGLIASHREGKLFAVSLCAGIGLGLFGAWLVAGKLHLGALTVPAAMLVAIVVYLVVFRLVRKQDKGSGLKPDQMLLIALFSGLVSHFVEMQTGIAVIATRTQFWIYAGVVTAMALGLEEQSRAVPPVRQASAGRRRRKKARASIHSSFPAGMLVPSLGVGLLLVTLGFDFIVGALIPGSGGMAMIGLFLLAWLLAGIPSILEAHQEGSSGEPRASWGNEILVYAFVSLGSLAAFLPFHLAAVNAPGAPTGVVTVFYLFLVGVLIAIALALVRAPGSRNGRLPRRFWREGRWWLHVLATVLVGVLIWRVNLSMVRADICLAWGRAWQASGELDQSIVLYERAVKLTPRQEHYYAFLGQAYLGKAVEEGESRWFEEARDAFGEGRRLSPLDPDHYANLGLLYYHWGRDTVAPEEKSDRLKMSLSYYKQVAMISPHGHGELARRGQIEAHLERANAYTAMGRLDQAVEEVTAAKALAPSDRKAELEEIIDGLRAREVSD